MFKNYLKIAFRNILRHKAFSFINIVGLAIGMASSILIMLWVENELSYDRFHARANNIYRVIVDASGFRAAVNPAGMPAGLKEAIPAIKNTVRLSHLDGGLFETGDRKFKETRLFYTDPSFLDVFSFPLLKGDRKTALSRVDALLLTQSMAKKYFGNQDPIGKTLRFNNSDLMTVTGVLADIPGNSHLQFDFILTNEYLSKNADDLRTNNYTNFNFYSYLELDPSADQSPAGLAKINRQMTGLYKQHSGMKALFELQPLTEIHLQPALQVDLPGHGNRQYVNVFFIVAFFVLAVACINFMNLATARSARRAREVGLRKVSGALRFQLVLQFLGESVLISFLAMLLAIAIVLLSLPAFNHLSGKELGIAVGSGKLLLLLAGIAVITGLVAGSYPAIFLSGFRPAKVLKGNLKSVGGNLLFRNSLVAAQFIISILLLVGTVVIYKQLQFIRHRDIGYAKENLLYMRLNGDIYGRMDALKNELKQHSETQAFTLVSDLPTNLVTGSANVSWEGKSKDYQVIIPSLGVNEEIVDVFKMKIIEGRNFSTAFKGDSANFIVNEKMAQIMGLKPGAAVGQSLNFDGDKGNIVGVVKNFNFKPIQNSIEPLVFRLHRNLNVLFIRTQPGKTDAAIKILQHISETLNPSFPFSYSFLDQDLDNLYKGEQQMGSIFNLFAVLAIFISCLGLYGLSAFMAEQRTKEIGVRKVLGASVFSIVYLLSTGFTKLIAVAIVIAVPLSWYMVRSWLESFAYHIDVSWMIFVLASLAALAIAWTTVSYESIRAAVMNPVRSLKSE